MRENKQMTVERGNHPVRHDHFVSLAFRLGLLFFAFLRAVMCFFGQSVFSRPEGQNRPVFQYDHRFDKLICITEIITDFLKVTSRKLLTSSRE